jgi:putative protein-disulfide isomerase
MSDKVLHYIFDPLCGWCYGAAPLVAAAHETPGLRIELHAGGLFIAPNTPRLADLRAHVIVHDRRIAQLSGQPFGAGYLDGLLHDPEAVLDSAPPIAAILTAQALAERGVEMLKRIQDAHYVEGRRVAEGATLAELATGLGFERAAFATAYEGVVATELQRHIADSRARLAQAGGAGFPTFVLETGGRQVPLDHAACFGRPAEFRRLLGAAG